LPIVLLPQDNFPEIEQEHSKNGLQSALLTTGALRRAQSPLFA